MALGDSSTYAYVACQHPSVVEGDKNAGVCLCVCDGETAKALEINMGQLDFDPKLTSPQALEGKMLKVEHIFSNLIC